MSQLTGALGVQIAKRSITNACLFLRRRDLKGKVDRQWCIVQRQLLGVGWTCREKRRRLRKQKCSTGSHLVCFDLFKRPWCFTEVCLQIQVAVKLSNWSIPPSPQGHFSKLARAFVKALTLYSGDWKPMTMSCGQSLARGGHVPNRLNSWRMPWWMCHLPMRRMKWSWKSRRGNHPSMVSCELAVARRWKRKQPWLYGKAFWVIADQELLCSHFLGPSSWSKWFAEKQQILIRWTKCTVTALYLIGNESLL